MKTGSVRILPTRRAFLKTAAAGAAAAALLPALGGFSPLLADETPKGRILILYFSHSGNTRALAEEIHKTVGGDLFELKTVNAYPKDYDDVVDAAKKEQQDDARPALVTPLPDFGNYSTIFLGFPNWWGTMPMPFFTLLEAHPLAGKTIVPFCTHEGSAFGRAIGDLKRLCPDAKILDGLDVRGSRAADSQERVNVWLSRLGFVK